MTDAEIIEALGDTGAVAAELQLSSTRVSNWKTRGIAWPYRAAIAQLAQRRKIKLPNDFLAPPSVPADAVQ